MSGQFRRHLAPLVFGTLCLATFQYAMNRIDWATKATVDRLQNGASVGTVVATIFALAFVGFVARVGSRWFIFNVGRDVEYELRGLLLEKLHTLGAAFYRKMPAGDIMSRASNDLMQVRLLFGFGALNLANVLFALVSALQVLLAISPKLTLVSFVTLPIILGSTRTVSKRLYTYTKENQETLGKLTERVQANLSGVRVVRSFALEGFEEKRFEDANRDYLGASLRLARLRGLFGPITAAATSIGTLAFFWYGGTLLLRGVASGGISKGDFFAFWLAYGRMTWPMIALGFSIAILQRGRAGWARLAEIFDAEPEIVDGGLAAPTDGGPVGISVKNLEFAYGERRVVDGVTFEVPPGTSLAVVGRTGSGKSTVAMLLARLLPTARGQVALTYGDGKTAVDVCDLPLTTLRGSVGYAQQDTFLFSTTVAKNIGLALNDSDSPEAIARIEAAAKEASVYEEILGLPEGFDTVVGERGVQLSGGQKQRVALARALLREPPILVLDDPLSAVDARTEANILAAIDRQKTQRTLLLVTHRVAAASRCDRIVVLDAGKVIASGTHDELVAAGGIYGSFAAEQAAEKELEAFGSAEVTELTGESR
jgi:ATP-binding cassette subfamily B protein